MVEIDPVLFEQALFNLLDNAAKYAPVGSTVRIEADKAFLNSVQNQRGRRKRSG